MASLDHFLGTLVFFVVILIALSSRYKPALGMAGKHRLWGPFSLSRSTQPGSSYPHGDLSVRSSCLTLGFRDFFFSNPMIF